MIVRYHSNKMTFHYCFIILALIGSCVSQLSDDVLFSIDWPGSLPLESTLNDNGMGSENELVLVTANNEQYKCVLPEVLENSKQESKSDMSSRYIELELLKPLFYQTACTYRLETYWSYELCHGKHLRQFHEEKDKLQEYYLGKYDMDSFSVAVEKAKTEQNKDSQKTHKIKNVLGSDAPYFEVLYDGGTVCDLTGESRRVTVQYVCHPEGRGEMYELKETSSCEYEAVILTHLLCDHPTYSSKKENVNKISCHAVSDSPHKPESLQTFEKETAAKDLTTDQDRAVSGLLDALNDLIDKAKKGALDADVDTEEDEPDTQTDTQGQRQGHSSKGEYVLSTEPPKQHVDKQILKAFLEGRHCVQGGTEWWRHEFCYGKHVIQYHEDKSSRTEIVLGRWNADKHVEWISNNPRKKPRPVNTRGTLTHLYSDGDVCDLTGQKRSVEVRLKCSVNPNHPNSISLYLVEPKPCEYKLVVESQLLCSVIKEADDSGLVHDLTTL